MGEYTNVGFTRSPFDKALFKTITWRIIATLLTMIIVYALTNRISIALEAGGIEIGAKMIAYYLHEKMWDKI